jgi:type IV secretion system protein TrbJ
MKVTSRVSKYVCVLVLCMTVQAHAQMAVFDASNFSQNVVTAKQSLLMTFKQIQQYCLQIQQYEQQIQQSANMVQNTVAPIAYVWDQALVTMNDVLKTIDVIDLYKKQAGSLQAYLNKFQDVNYYRSSPCFGPNGCTQQQLAALQNTAILGSQSQKQANDALVQAIEKQQLQLRQDAANLVLLQNAAQSAGGRMEALQAANQLASNQAAQLMQIRALLVAQANAAAAKLQTDADKQAQGGAADQQVVSSKPDPTDEKGWSF